MSSPHFFSASRLVDISRLFGNIHGTLNGNANISSIERRGIIDTVSHIPHDVSSLLEGEDDALFLIGLNCL
jgi:hypothetical protein